MQQHPIVSREEWLTARRALLAREKEMTHLRDSINAERQALPWVRVGKPYVFDTPEGKKGLADLFDGRSQLVVYHFMLGPGWQAGCPSCSLVADHFDGMLPHLEHRDVTLTAISRAPLGEISAYKRRMGWRFPWASSFGGDFNYDYQVSFTPEDLARDTVIYNFGPIASAHAFEELHGLSVFHRSEAGDVFHTYSAYARGVEELLGVFMVLDRTPKGRNEKTIMDWVRRHDEYEDEPRAHACCGTAA